MKSKKNDKIVLTRFGPTIGGIVTQCCPIFFKVLQNRHDSPKIPKKAAPPLDFDARNFFFLLSFPRHYLYLPMNFFLFVKFNWYHMLMLKRDLTCAIDVNKCFLSKILHKPMNENDENDENEWEINFELISVTEVVMIIFRQAHSCFWPVPPAFYPALLLTISFSFLLLIPHSLSLSFFRSFPCSLENRTSLSFSLSREHGKYTRYCTTTLPLSILRTVYIFMND